MTANSEFARHTSQEYQNLLASRDIQTSMSRPGDCYDNAAVESLFGTLKSELVDHRDYQSRTEAKSEIFEYIEVFYNRQRRHSSLGYLSQSNMSPPLLLNPVSTISEEHHEQHI